MAKLSNIKKLGRFENTETKKQVNLYKGRNLERGTDIIYYLVSGKREFVTDRDFYSIYKKIQ